MHLISLGEMHNNIKELGLQWKILNFSTLKNNFYCESGENGPKAMSGSRNKIQNQLNYYFISFFICKKNPKF